MSQQRRNPLGIVLAVMAAIAVGVAGFIVGRLTAKTPAVAGPKVVEKIREVKVIEPAPSTARGPFDDWTLELGEVTAFHPNLAFMIGGKLSDDEFATQMKVAQLKSLGDKIPVVTNATERTHAHLLFQTELTEWKGARLITVTVAPYQFGANKRRVYLDYFEQAMIAWSVEEFREAWALAATTAVLEFENEWRERQKAIAAAKPTKKS